MVSKKRVQTLQMMVGAHPALLNEPRTSDVVKELKRVVGTRRITGSDRWLLQVLHTTRALDTCLSLLVLQRGWTVPTPSLGAYLIRLRNENVIVEHQRSHWQSKIVNPRNRYMHSANQMPQQHTADDLLDEMDACLSIILAAV